MPLIDTHCHLNLDAFLEDIDLVINRSINSGVKSIVVPGIDIPSSIIAVKLANVYPQIYAAVGIHPNSLSNLPPDWLTTISSLLENKKVVAIGEIGLDYYRNKASSNTQIDVLEKQLQIAEENNLPVILHNRQASNDIGQRLTRWQAHLRSKLHPLADCPGVFHSFDGEFDFATLVTNANFYLGISGSITFYNAKYQQDLIARLPLENLLLETDAPFLSPQPLRGKRNEPANLKLISQKISELKNISLISIENITTMNAERVFKI